MLSLPPAPQPAPRRQVFLGTALACAAGTMLIGGMLATWLQFRADAPVRESMKRGFIKDWMPADIVVPEVAANMMLIAFCVACVMAQWAVYSAKRADRQHAGMAFGVTGLVGLAILNAQIFIWTQMGVGARDGAFHSMFYAITGMMTVLLVAGIVFSLVAAFRYLGGRTKEIELVSSQALYWYFLTAAFSAVWVVVYVQK
ncbi:MAG: cytochrome c oxidase subunit 3 [Actinomycetota bacterium]